MTASLTLAASLAFAALGGSGAPQAGGLVSGIITDATGRGLPGATIAVVPAEGQRRVTVTDGAGRYRVEGLTPGLATLEVSMAGFDTRLTALTVSPGTRNVWSGTLLVAPALGEMSIERQVMQLTGLAAVDCGRYAAPASEAALRRSLDCAVTAAAARRPFSAILQFPAGSSHDGEGLLGGTDGVVQLFEYKKGGVRFRTTPCRFPRLSRPKGGGRDFGFACQG